MRYMLLTQPPPQNALLYNENNSPKRGMRHEDTVTLYTNWMDMVRIEANVPPAVTTP